MLFRSLILTNGGNDYVGLTDIQAGQLQVTADGALGTIAGGTTVATGAALEFAGGVNYATLESVTLDGGAVSAFSGNNTFAGPINLTADSIVDAAAGAALTLTGVISEDASARAIQKTGAGEVTLTNTNTYTGATNVNVGRLVITASQALGTTAAGTTVAVGATLEVDGSGGNVTGINEALTLSGTLDSTAGDNVWAGSVAVNSTINVDAGSLEVSGQITGTNGLTKTGNGRLILSNATNNYTGVTDIQGGQVRVTVNNALGADSAVANRTIVGAGTALEFQDVAYTTTESVDLNGGTIASVGTGASSFAGAIQLLANSTVDTVTSTSLTLDGVISEDAAGRELRKTGAGTATLTATNTYTGQTQISGGSLQVQNGDAINDASRVNLDTAGADLTLLNDETVQRIDGIAGTTVTLGANTLTVVPGAGMTGDYDGAISGTGGVTVTGTGTGRQILSGVNTYTGVTTVNSGTLELQDGSAVFDTTGGVVNVAGGTLEVTDSETIGALHGAGTVAVGAGATLSTDGLGTATPFAGNFTGGATAGIRKVNTAAGNATSNKLSLTGDSSAFAGTTDVDAGILDLDGKLGNATSTTNVNSGGTLQGTGTAGGTVSVKDGGMLAPGDSPGSFTVNNITFEKDSTFVVDLQSDYDDAGTDYDELIVTGTATIQNDALVSFVDAGGGDPAAGDTLKIINNQGGNPIGLGSQGGFKNAADSKTLKEGSIVQIGDNNKDAVVSYSGGDGDDFVLQVVGGADFSGDGELELRLVGNSTKGFVVEFLDDGKIQETRNLNAVKNQTITVTGTGGTTVDDRLTINYIDDGGDNGFFDVDIVFNGGESAGDNDKLRIIGDSSTTTGNYTPEGGVDGKGMISISGTQDSNAGTATIDFDQLEPLEVSAMPSFTFTTPLSDDVIDVSATTATTGSVNGLLVTGTSGGTAFEALTIFDVTSFTIDTGANDAAGTNTGDDTVTITSGLDKTLGDLAQNLSNFTVDTGESGANDVDAVNINPSIDLPGTLLINKAETVTVADAKDVKAGSVQITNVDNKIILGNGTDVTSTGGLIDLQTGVNEVRLNGATATTHTIDGNGDAAVKLGKVTAANSPDLVVNSEGGVDITSVNLGTTGDLTVHVDDDNDGAEAGTFGALDADVITIKASGVDKNDTLTFNEDVTAQTTLDINNAQTVKLASKLYQAKGGDLDIQTGVGGVLLTGANTTTVTLKTTGANGAVNLGPTTATNNVNLTFVTVGDADATSVDINTGVFDVDIDTDDGANATVATGTFGAISAGNIDIRGGVPAGPNNDKFTFNGQVTTTDGGAILPTVTVVAAQATLNAGIQTDGGKVDFTGTPDVVLGATVTIDTDKAGGTEDAGEVAFSTAAGADINATTAGVEGLTINTVADGGGADANVTLPDVGIGTALGKFTVLAGDKTITLNDTDGDNVNEVITSNADITFGSFTQLTDNALIKSQGGDIDFSATTVFGSKAGIDVTFNSSGGGVVDAGNVLLGNFSDRDNVITKNFINDVSVDASGGGKADGNLQLHGKVLLDHDGVADPSDFKVITATDIDVIVAGNAVIDTEQGGNDPGGQINLGTGNLSASAADKSLTLDARGNGTGANIDFGTVNSTGGGKFLAALDARTEGAGLITVDQDVTVGGNPPGGIPGVLFAGRVLVDGDRTIATNGGASANSSDVDLQNAIVFAKTAATDKLTIDTSSTGTKNAGNVDLGVVSNDGGANQLLHDLKINAAPVTGTAGTLTIHAGVTLNNDFDYEGGKADFKNAASFVETNNTGTISIRAVHDDSDITMADGSRAETNNANITFKASNDIELSLIDVGGAGNTAFLLADDNTTGDDVSPNDGEITDVTAAETANVIADNVVFDAGTGIGTGVAGDKDDIDITKNGGGVQNLAARTDSGNINIHNVGGLNVTTVGGVVGVKILSTGQDNNDDIFLVAASPVTVDDNIENQDGGDITVAADGGAAADTVTINAGKQILATGGNGDINVIGGGQVTLNADATAAAKISAAGSGKVTVRAGQNFTTSATVVDQDLKMNEDATGTKVATIQSESGEIDISATRDVLLGRVNADSDGTGGKGLVRVRADRDNGGGATAGKIIDNTKFDIPDGAGNENVIGGVIRFIAANGIGSDATAELGDTSDIDIDGATLFAVNTNPTSGGTTNHIQFHELNDIGLDEVHNLAQAGGIQGDVVIDAGGQVTDNSIDAPEVVNIKAVNVAVRAVTGIGVDGDDASDKGADDKGDIDTQITGTFAAETNSGDINVENTGGLTIGAFGGLTGVVITDTADDNSGDDNITLRANSPVAVTKDILNKDGGGVRVIADGGTSTDTIDINPGITVATQGGDGNVDAKGNIELIAGGAITLKADATGAANVSADGSGKIDVHTGTNFESGKAFVPGSGAADTDFVMQESGANTAQIQSQDGPITLSATRDVVLTNVDADSDNDGLANGTNKGDVTVTADSDKAGVTADTHGKIIDSRSGEGAGKENIVGNVITLKASNGIGSGAAIISDLADIDIDGTTLAAFNTNPNGATGTHIQIFETNDIALDEVHNLDATSGFFKGAEVVIDAGGKITDADETDDTATNVKGESIALNAKTGIGMGDGRSRGDIDLEHGTGATLGVAAKTDTGNINIEGRGSRLIVVDTGNLVGVEITDSLGKDGKDLIALRSNKSLFITESVTNKSAGNITIAAEGATNNNIGATNPGTDSDVTLASGSVASTTDGTDAGDIEIFAGGDVLHFAGDVTTVGKGTIHYSAGEDFNGDPAGGPSSPAPGAINADIVMKDGRQATTGSGFIHLEATRDVLVSKLSTTGTVIVSADDDDLNQDGKAGTTGDGDGKIIDNLTSAETANITASAAILRAGDGIGDGLAGDVTDIDTTNPAGAFTLTAETDTGDINIHNQGELIVDEVIDPAEGQDLEDVRITAGMVGDDITLRAESPVTINPGRADADGIVNIGGGNITVAAEGTSNATPGAFSTADDDIKVDRKSVV